MLSHSKSDSISSVIGRSGWEVKTVRFFFLFFFDFACFSFRCDFNILFFSPSNRAARSAGVIIRNTAEMMMMMTKELNEAPFFCFSSASFRETIHLDAAAVLRLSALFCFFCFFLFFAHFPAFIAFFPPLFFHLFLLSKCHKCVSFFQPDTLLEKPPPSPLSLPSHSARAKPSGKTVQSLGLLLSVWQKFHYCRRPLVLISTDAEHPFVLRANVIFFNISCRETCKKKNPRR